MNTTTRKMTIPIVRPVPVSRPGPPPFPSTATPPSRPRLADAPDWFNRARAKAVLKQSNAAQPVQFTRIPPAPPGGATRRWPVRNQTIALAAALAAVPIVFLMGFWTHRAVTPAQHVAASRDKANSPTRKPANRDVATRDWKGDAAPLFYSPPPAADPAPPQMNISLFNFGQVKPGEQTSEVARTARPASPETNAAKPPAVASRSVTRTPSNETDSAAPVVQTAAAADVSGPVDGFTLRSSVAGQFVADVQVPGNSWFSLASATTADCESGTCQLVPVKTADRKLNTLLEWASTPQQAAEQAAREGKQVFLIHVSGNFAQPGFT